VHGLTARAQLNSVKRREEAPLAPFFAFEGDFEVVWRQMRGPF